MVQALRAERDGAGSERYYTAATSPLSPKTFRAAAREGRFSSFRVGKRIYALREDVHRYIEAQKRPVKVVTSAPGDQDEIGRLLDAAGIAPRRCR